MVDVTRETFSYYLAESENGWCKIPRRVADDMARGYARLQEQVETLTKERDCDPDGCKAHIDAFMARAEAAEAERDRLREERDDLAIRALVIDEALTNATHLLRSAESERDHFREKFLLAYEALTPASEVEKRGMQRVLAILEWKKKSGTGPVRGTFGEKWLGRCQAFDECAEMLRLAVSRAALHKEPRS